MSLRNFTVFQDTPSTEIPNHEAATDSTPPPSSSSHLVAPTTATSLANLVATADKENVHPLTGERAGSSSNKSNKKRKTNALVPNVPMPLGTKKQKETREPKAETKKRKASSAPKVKKDGKGSKSARKVGKKSSRKASPMPELDEDASLHNERQIVQADIDSRCYELTVQPLADVSQAYELSFKSEEHSDPSSVDKVKFGDINGSSVKLELRDYFPPPLSTSNSVSSATNSDLPTPPEASQEVKTFSTPERKQIYAAFTFSSPSPTSERFSKASQSTSISLPQIAVISPKPTAE